MINANLTFSDARPTSRHFALWVAVLALAVPCAGCTVAVENGKTDDANLSSLPAEVRDALDRAARTYAHPLDGAKWDQVKLLSGTDHPVYQFRGKNSRGNTIEMEATSAGRVIEVEEHGIALGEVPPVVVDALKTRMRDRNPEKVEAIYQAGQAKPVCYGFEGSDSAGKAIEVYISADGKTFLN